MRASPQEIWVKETVTVIYLYKSDPSIAGVRFFKFKSGSVWKSDKIMNYYPAIWYAMEIFYGTSDRRVSL